ncbi:PilW family protein [Neisseria shayeganii]|uniref:Prepilin-type N-terminal cleavage/methylation domain-containing protein n=1 Tax=Neisseria shayeganii TaxID=607712 RepID=A0A7D7T514_9NEIS|nr:prepilin-type N-terminal cleavage/methylation domain-containing protein [Neisseria shayeganii]QMT39553.1 prepilin-type N-terminal cleavage/methylation domain-containing protein [Neisseria shayeganii]
MLLRHKRVNKSIAACKLGFNSNKGFTLIEFLVASSLGIIVLLAIGTTYTITNTMKRTSENRLAAQQDLRAAAEMIIRDARMAGSFGCFNLGNLEQKSFPGINDSAKGLQLQLGDEKFSGVSVFNINNVRSAFNQNSFELLGDPLVFSYGINPEPVSGSATVSTSSNVAAWAAAGGRVALASCFKMEIDGVTVSNGDVRVNGALPRQDTLTNDDLIFYTPQTTLSQLHVNAYAIGRVAGVDDTGSMGLYRFTLAPNGEWQGPQLLVANIHGMDITTTYAGCGTNTEATFSDSYINLKNNPAIGRVSSMPAILELRLQLSNNDQTHGRFNEYLIRANVRGGNVCAGL